MSNLLKDKISRKDARELKRLRRSSRLRTVGTMAFIVISLGFVFAVLASVDRDHSANQRYTDSQLHSWTDDFKAQRKSYTDMVGRYGGKGAAQSFERYSLKLFTSVSQSIPADVPYNELGLASRIMLSIYLGLLQLSFILIVWWKIWLLVLVAAMVWGCWSLRPYKAKDFLGVLTNGTLFYTGIRADLENVNSDGAPNVQAQGLACPQSVPLSQAKRSAMAKILEEHDALNNTTLELVAILEFYREYPAYIAEQGEEELLAQAMDVPNLPTNAAYLLSVAFDLLNHYKAGRFSSAEVGASPTPVGEQSPEEIKAMPIEEYMQAYRSCLHRSLTPDMRSALAELSYTELAAIVLGFESGKVLAYGYEAGKWVRTSNFPQLSARAVLHSVASFSDDYDYDSRTTVRRALIYASRQSAFGPVRLPVALSATARAARQWTELQLATPHQLHATTDAVSYTHLRAHET